MRSLPRINGYAKFEESRKWHDWFAWRPVTADCDEKHYQWVWREVVERKYHMFSEGPGCFLYRIKK